MLCYIDICLLVISMISLLARGRGSGPKTKCRPPPGGRSPVSFTGPPRGRQLNKYYYY